MSSRKTMKKDSRLQAAKHWIPTYTGKNIVQGYHKKYGVSLICAANELKLLGIEISDTYISQLKQAEENIRKLKEQKATSKKLKELEGRFPDLNETFYYIFGYTSGGAPYGITWEEMGLEPYDEIDEDELQF